MTTKPRATQATSGAEGNRRPHPRGGAAAVAVEVASGGATTATTTGEAGMVGGTRAMRRGRTAATTAGTPAGAILTIVTKGASEAETGAPTAEGGRTAVILAEGEAGVEVRMAATAVTATGATAERVMMPTPDGTRAGGTRKRGRAVTGGVMSGLGERSAIEAGAVRELERGVGVGTRAAGGKERAGLFPAGVVEST